MKKAISRIFSALNLWRTITPLLPYSITPALLTRAKLVLHYSITPVLCALCLCSTTEHGGSNAALLPTRIVSLAPSITETLFALGLGDRVVGVTSYCHYPPAADTIEEVGGYSDPNLEKIVSMSPDLVVLQTEHEKPRTFLTRYGIPVLAVSYLNAEDICSTFAAIGKRCGVKSAADSLINLFAETFAKGDSATHRPSVLLCVGREGGSTGGIHTVFAAGAGTFYNDFIRAAGGRNAFADSLPQYPKLSREGLISLAPDIIIDIASAMGAYACSTLVADWQPLKFIPAVENNRVYCIAQEYATVPGPRVLLLVEELRRIIIAEDT